jgi:glutaredoxin 3
MAVVAGLVLVGWPLLQQHRERQLAALRASEEQLPGAPQQREVAPATQVEEQAPAPEPGERTYYRYLDASGSLHYVDSLERVPEAFRDSAKPMAMAGSRQSQAPQLTRAETQAPKRRPFAEAAAQPPARRASAGAGVVVYSTSWCPWCRKTLAWLDERGIDYENRDIEKNPAWREELIEKSGGVSIPVVEIGGELIHGFQPAKMGELL